MTENDSAGNNQSDSLGPGESQDEPQWQGATGEVIKNWVDTTMLNEPFILWDGSGMDHELDLREFGREVTVAAVVGMEQFLSESFGGVMDSETVSGDVLDQWFDDIYNWVDDVVVTWEEFGLIDGAYVLWTGDRHESVSGKYIRAVQTIMESAIPNIAKGVERSIDDGITQTTAMISAMHSTATHFTANKVEELTTSVSQPAVERAEEIVMEVILYEGLEDDQDDDGDPEDDQDDDGDPEDGLGDDEDPEDGLDDDEDPEDGLDDDGDPEDGLDNDEDPEDGPGDDEDPTAAKARVRIQQEIDETLNAFANLAVDTFGAKLDGEDFSSIATELVSEIVSRSSGGDEG